MGGEQFEARASAKSAAVAFTIARDKALYDYGHRGYTGTIAEKQEFREIALNPGETPEACMERCYAEKDHFVDDKWGPAGCIDTGPDPKVDGSRIFIFFGWASS